MSLLRPVRSTCAFARPAPGLLAFPLALLFCAGSAAAQPFNGSPAAASALAAGLQPSLSAIAPRAMDSTPAVAFDRYIAAIRARNPFSESGPVIVAIEGSLPALEKRARVLAIRETGSSERSGYHILSMDGDAVVKQQVIARYLTAQEQAEALPYSSVEVTPANYKFRYMGSMETEESTVFIFRVTPKKKRLGLMQGEIWIDAATGIAVHQSGRFVKSPSVFIRRIKVVRDVMLREGQPSMRVSQVIVETRLVGSAELTIMERTLESSGVDTTEAAALQNR